MFKRVLCLLLFIMIFATGCGRKKDEPKDLLDTIKARGKVIVGVKNDTKPFGFLDKDGNLIGYDIDIAKKIAYLIFGDENQIEFVPVTPSNRIMKLNSGQVDMLVATMSVTSQRLQLFDFSTTYHIAGQVYQNSMENISNELDGFEIPTNVAVLKQLISKLPSGVTKQTGAQIIKQTMEALGISMTSVLQEAQQVQEGLNNSARDCQSTIIEYRKQINLLEKQAQKYQRQYAALNDIISLFIQTSH